MPTLTMNGRGQGRNEEKGDQTLLPLRGVTPRLSPPIANRHVVALWSKEGLPHGLLGPLETVRFGKTVLTQPCVAGPTVQEGLALLQRSTWPALRGDTRAALHPHRPAGYVLKSPGYR